MKPALPVRATPRPMRTARLVSALTVAVLGAASGGCSKGTYLEIVFEGAGLPPVRQINLTITRNTDLYYASGPLPDGVDAASTGVVKFPSSVAFQLDGLAAGTPLTVAADAISPTGAVVAHAQIATTVMHAKTWTVTLDFAASIGGGLDGSPDDAPTDAADDGRALVRITDGSVAEGSVGCVAATVEASESVTVDYESSGGSNPDAGNMLRANLGSQERTVGWMKFGLMFIPNKVGNFRITKATLNLVLSQLATGMAPQLKIRSSTKDGWTRKSGAGDISLDDKMSEMPTAIPPQPPPAVNAYALDVKNHDWAADIVDGTITLGVENVTALAGTVTSSKVEFFGVAAPLATDTTRPTLDLEFCR
jgi:hypothetical protein